MVKKLKNKQGFTLLEVLTVVGILCVILTIVVPSLWMIGRSLEYQKRCNYARTIFLTAQRELVELRSSGRLDLLPPDADALGQREDAEGTPPAGYVYTHSGSRSFAWILPEDFLEETLRNQQILIEYHPESGSVYSVFYYEGKESLAELYAAGDLHREEKLRKKLLLGYYSGSGLTDPELGIYHVAADIRFDNGQEGIVTVAVPAQALVSGEAINFMGDDYHAFASGLTITLTVTGERGGTFTKTIKACGDTENWTVGTGPGGVNAILATYTLDSLLDYGSFASLPENDKTPEGQPASRRLTDIQEGDYVILPGDNVSIGAEVTFRPGLEDPLVLIESAALAGVNPMFASLTPGPKGQILAISNGRNLQNLNALAPEIARDVEAVVFFPEQNGKGGTDRVIDWNETVAYYGNLPGVSAADQDSEAPARRLPYFAPIQNPYLFGTVEFLQPEDSAPRLRAVDLRSGKENARIVGNGVRICNLKLDAGAYTSAAAFYGVTQMAAEQKLVGLFGYVNTGIDGITLVNPVVRGRQGDDTHAAAAGALAGAAGPDSRISRCYVYIDTGAAAFVKDRLNMTDFAGEDDGYGVSGWGSVGGLIGYMESGKDNAWAVTSCFAAVPVFGKMETGDFCGYRNGVGGLVGNAQMTGFAGCYASGTVIGKGCTVVTGVAENNAGITAYGADSTGAGGFVGTSQGGSFGNCFASGNVRGTDSSTGAFAGVLCWDSILGSRKTKMTDCYGAGTASYGKTTGAFAGVAAVVKPARLPAALNLQNCYYLSHYQQEQTAATLGKPAPYEALGSVATAGFADWHLPEQTHSYGEGDVYPFLLPTGLTTYYGLWPEQNSCMAAAYYETYERGTGYYVPDWEYDTLRDAPVKEDGYVILSACTGIAAKAGDTLLELTRDAGTVTLDGSAWYVFQLPLDALSAAAGESFYAKVTLLSPNDSEGSSVYINPDVAMGISGTAGEIPSVRIRSARQLIALGGGRMGGFLHLNFVQKTDISLSGKSFMPIGGFSGSYDGSGKTISGLTESLFAHNAGTISNLHLQTREKGNLAQCNSGSIIDCSVTAGETLSVPGLVTVNRGSLVSCRVDAAVHADGSGPAGILVGQMLEGSIRECSVHGSIEAEGGAVIGTFAGSVEAGEIINCHTTGENSRYPFAGFAAEVSSEAIHPDATHYLGVRLPDGIVSREDAGDFRPVDNSHRKPKYAAVLENCTFLLNGESRPAIGRQYYYLLEPLDGRILEAIAPDTAAVEPGDYVLASEDGSVLHFTEGGSLEWLPETAGTTLLEGMLWHFDGERWTMAKSASVKTEKEEPGEEKTVVETVTVYTIAPAVTIRAGSGSTLAATVDYTITAQITETRTLGTEPSVVRVETKTAAQGSEACLLYRVAPQTGYHATCVDTRDALVVPEG